jgi:Tfp pilus assembly protein PilP
VAPAASAAPEAQSEPEVKTAARSLPTNASVARQATTKNALNLSRVALLGVFGTASGRYAMVRQPGGGVKKVVVGDRLDGGQIAAITTNAVQYQKGGRVVTLSLPTG